MERGKEIDMKERELVWFNVIQFYTLWIANIIKIIVTYFETVCCKEKRNIGAKDRKLKWLLM